MKLEKIYERKHWFAEVKEQNFLAEDKGLRVYAIDNGMDEEPLADGAEISPERAEILLHDVPDGTKVNEYFRYLRGREGAPWKGVKDIMHVATYIVHKVEGLTMAEKMQLLNGAGPEDVERIQASLGDGYVVGVEDGRVYVRKDMRRKIRAALAANKVTVSALAARLGKRIQNTSKYLVGKCGTTNDSLEEILWLIEDEM